MLGAFSVTAVLPDGGQVSLTDGIGRANKLRIFLEYLAFHRDREIPHGELFELLWPPRGDGENPMSALKLIVLRARAELGGGGPLAGKEIIVNRRAPMPGEVLSIRSWIRTSLKICAAWRPMKMETGAGIICFTPSPSIRVTSCRSRLRCPGSCRLPPTIMTGT
jgi:hypothetical protein